MTKLRLPFVLPSVFAVLLVGGLALHSVSSQPIPPETAAWWHYSVGDWDFSQYRGQIMAEDALRDTMLAELATYAEIVRIDDVQARLVGYRAGSHWLSGGVPRDAYLEPNRPMLVFTAHGEFHYRDSELTQISMLVDSINGFAYIVTGRAFDPSVIVDVDIYVPAYEIPGYSQTEMARDEQVLSTPSGHETGEVFRIVGPTHVPGQRPLLPTGQWLPLPTPAPAN